MNKKSYSEKLRDPRWQKMRLEILQRDNWTCQKCEDAETELQIHHKYYVGWNDPWECDPNTLVTLCKHCHEEEEGCKGMQDKLINTFLDIGFFNGEMDYFAAVIGSAYKKTGKRDLDSILLSLAMDGIFGQALIAFHKEYSKTNGKAENPIDDLPF